MKATLQIRNFGPIKDINIEVNKFNVLIGPHASGKSTISKVLCIIHSLDHLIVHLPDEKRETSILKPMLVYYRLEEFYQEDTYWFFEDDNFTFTLEQGKINADIKEDSGDVILKTESYYFPAERIALPMVAESIFELNLSDSILPKYFLQFGSDFTKAKKAQQVFNLPLLNVEFEYSEERNIVTLRNNKQLTLQETSSAIQANLPLMVILQHPIRNASMFVIEELELHSFPQLQKDTLHYIIQRMRHPKLKDSYVVLPTHSPYLLSAVNNLLVASKVANSSIPAKEKIDRIISSDSWIDINEFSAYYIKDGGATSIIDKETGLIHENELDGVSEDLAGEFDALMELYNPSLI